MECQYEFHSVNFVHLTGELNIFAIGADAGACVLLLLLFIYAHSPEIQILLQ